MHRMDRKSDSRGADIAASKAATRMMLRTLFSTTLRIFVPITILFIVGLIIDLNTATKPWGMAIGTGLGIIIAIFLIFAQLKDIHQNPWRPSPSQGGK